MFLTKLTSIIVLFTVTAYSDVNGDLNSYGITASGIPTRPGIVACSKEIPFGTYIYLFGQGLYICEDRGSAITKDRIDIYFPTEEEAINFGKQEMYGIIKFRITKKRNYNDNSISW